MSQKTFPTNYSEKEVLNGEELVLIGDPQAGNRVKYAKAQNIGGNGKVGTKSVDETAIGDDKILVYKTASGKLEYEAKPTGGSGGFLREVSDVGTQYAGNVLFEGAIGKATTLSAGYLTLTTAPTGANFIITISKSTDSGATYPTTETVTLTAGSKYVKGTLTLAFAEGDWMKAEVTQVGSTIAGQGLLFSITGT